MQSQIRSIRQEKISGDNIYRLLLAFDQVYEAASEVERKEFMRAFIERIELFPEKQPDGNWIRKIIFNFPVPVSGAEAVSYTHLDVYKRQAPGCWRSATEICRPFSTAAMAFTGGSWC